MNKGRPVTTQLNSVLLRHHHRQLLRQGLNRVRGNDTFDSKDVADGRNRRNSRYDLGLLSFSNLMMTHGNVFLMNFFLFLSNS